MGKLGSLTNTYKTLRQILLMIRMTMPCYKSGKSMMTTACYKNSNDDNKSNYNDKSDNNDESNNNKDKVCSLLRR